MIHILVVDNDCKLKQVVCIYVNECGFDTEGVLSAKDDIASK